MTDRHDASKRNTLKTLGTLGAAIAMTPVMSGQEKPTANAVDVASERFTKGHSCAQAVCSALADTLGVDYDTAVKMSCGFGGGMYLNGVCGAVTGGIMAIGLKHGGASQQSGIRTALLVRQFADRFKAEHKSINCTELVGLDLSTIDLANPQALQTAYKAAVEKGLFNRCAGFVKDATTIAGELIKA